MRLIVNASNIVVGGGIQVSLSFIEELKKFKDHEYHLFLSIPIAKQIDRNSFPNNFSFYFFNVSPSSFTKGHKVRKELNRLEKSIKPDLVFTVFGPAYWKPKTLHISGFADGWCYNPNSIAFKQLSFEKKLRNLLIVARKNREIAKADYIVVETKVAKTNISRYLGINDDRIFVVGNTYHSIYSHLEKSKNLNEQKRDEFFKLLVLSAFYPHKNLKIINEVIPILKSKTKKKFVFYLTIKDQDFRNNFIDSDYIQNLGPQRVSDCPQLYDKTDALFLPTLLETFSANYPEAMIMNKPILTSGYDFAQDVCRDAALYFDPLNPEDIADKIIQLSESENLYQRLIENGKKRILELETPRSRAEKYLNIFKEVFPGFL
jgi:glycosyltransferase involved in cell wall biosynthesis